MSQVIIFSTAYLPPISYISKLLEADKVIIEQHEHFIKQTYRNRTEIYGANGMLPLVIPVDHHNLFTLPIKDVKISYDQPWQKIHWRSIESAYRNSPYFEYYEDEFRVFYEKKYIYLFELNCDLLKTILKIIGIGIEKKISFTETYQKDYDEKADLRNAFVPGKNAILNSQFSILNSSYTQVFSNRHGFIPNLSIIDLLFCEGPKAIGN